MTDKMHPYVVEGSMILLAIGSLAAIFPPLAGLMSALYYGLKAWETETVMALRKRAREWLFRNGPI